ncbi:hypothetical protein S7711_09824 [Stachybotrys chartarum IBT 7711]|uniref:Major facilitator superfamily (MFS) profile domain-containing protein n=1 Tax=Stachybotrys chartarum (strain CBS 109288 / IBT 7711) TaxID=1280523 RepID=A0A084B7N5_STACB|nr:hypothetical protein S7711_09824 [Stachybotrys chartarum IBT 7711]
MEMSTVVTHATAESPQSARLEGDIVESQPQNQDAESNRVYVPVYSRFSSTQKRSITAFLAFCGLLATISTTSVLAAIPEIVATFQTTAPIISVSNAVYLALMGTERATSLGWFLSGTMVGPAFGPVLGGLIVTYTSWRVIFWLQTALGGVAAMLAYFILPETHLNVRVAELKGKGLVMASFVLWKRVNPVGIFKLYGHRNLLCVLTTPLQSGMLYISPGVGYLIGTLIGGRWADRTVLVWATKRGYRLPEDRLRSSLPFLGVLLPGSMLIYGWMVDQRIGGIPVPVICMFLQGLAQLAAFPSLNTYILDVMQDRSGEASVGGWRGWGPDRTIRRIRFGTRESVSDIAEPEPASEAEPKSPSRLILLAYGWRYRTGYLGCGAWWDGFASNTV